MRKATTTNRIKITLNNGMLYITKAEICNKDTGETKIIDADTLKDSLEFLCESIFVDAIGWHYEKTDQIGQYISECGRMNPDCEVIITVYLQVNDSVNVEDIERALKIKEE